MLIFVTIRCLSILSLMGLMGVGDEVSQGNHYASHQRLSVCSYIYIYAYRTLGRSQNKKWKFLPFSVGPPHFHFLLKFEYTKIHQKELKNSVLGPKTTCIFGKKKLKDTRDPRPLMANALIFFFHFLDSFPFFADATLVLYTLMILVTLVISLRPGQPLCLILRKNRIFCYSYLIQGKIWRAHIFIMKKVLPAMD